MMKARHLAILAFIFGTFFVSTTWSQQEPEIVEYEDIGYEEEEGEEDESETLERLRRLEEDFAKYKVEKQLEAAEAARVAEQEKKLTEQV